MKKIISFLLSLAMILGTISFAEEWNAEEAEFSNSEMNMRSDLKGKFSNKKEKQAFLLHRLSGGASPKGKPRRGSLWTRR